MNNKLEEFMINNMVEIPHGIESIRKFHDQSKWISSNYKMSIPSNGRHQTQTVEDVNIKSFYLAKVPVTNQLFSMITGGEVSGEKSGNLPKVNISWLEAIDFCNKLSSYFALDSSYLISDDNKDITYIKEANGFRLPMDSEWQYACKASSKAYQYSKIDEIAWHAENSKNTIQDVAMKQGNAWGLYDMLGNVWEWCWDLFNPETYDSYRVFRGGSFAEESRICGATTRRKSFPTFAIDDLGFRLARSVK